jgi:hypothetical protein
MTTGTRTSGWETKQNILFLNITGTILPGYCFVAEIFSQKNFLSKCRNITEEMFCLRL